MSVGVRGDPQSQTERTERVGRVKGLQAQVPALGATQVGQGPRSWWTALLPSLHAVHGLRSPLPSLQVRLQDGKWLSLGEHRPGS